MPIKLSIVTTLFFSEDYIQEFCSRSSRIAKELVNDDYEILIINDGSPDNSLPIAINLIQNDSHIRLIDLSRNFGHQNALLTGLAHANGDHIYLIDVDLEEEPEWLLNFFKVMVDEKSDVVYGVQKYRKGGFFERWTGHLYYKILDIVGVRLPKNICTARLMTRRFNQALLEYSERELFLGGLFSLVGFKQSAYIVEKHSTSPTTFNFKRKIALILNSIISFSSFPLIAIFIFGLVISFLSFVYILYLFLFWMFLATPPTGWTSLIISIWTIGGLNFFFIGIIGIYLNKVFMESKQRPRTIIRQIYEKKR